MSGAVRCRRQRRGPGDGAARRAARGGQVAGYEGLREDDRFHADQQLTAIEGDSFRQFHPDYEAVMKHDRLRMPEVTAQAAGRWTGMAVDEALGMRASVIVEGAWRNASVPMNGVANAAEHGHRVHAVVLAVPPEQSRRGTADRYYEGVKSGVAARWTPSSAHDQAVASLPGTVRAPRD